MLSQSAFEQRVNLESSKATYSTTVVDYTPPATATDFFVIAGVKGKRICITNIRMSAAATAAGYQGVYMYKRTAANVGGTVTTTPVTSYDSADPASSCAPTQYLTNPSSLGTGSLMRSDHLPLSATGTVGAPELIWDFGNRAAKCPVLNGAGEFFCLSMLGLAVAAGMNIHLTVEWTEE